MKTETALGRSPAASKFILHWGEMGTRWGINRTIAQIHALLYISPRPLTAEEVAEALQVARSNVSTSLRELQNWGVIRTVPQFGDRREHYESLRDVWEMFRMIIDERKRRELDPTLAMLNECLQEAEAQGDEVDAFETERIRELHSFFNTTATWYSQIRQMPPRTLARFLDMGAAVHRLLGPGRDSAPRRDG